MIIAIEGTSASGKTRWCREHAGEAWVPEDAPGRERWQAALTLEKEHGIAVCDTDPAKLYYPWSLWKSGRGSEQDWQAAYADARTAFEAGELGLPDAIFFAERDIETLVHHRTSDPTRQRRRFWLHVELQPWFRKWWEAVAAYEHGHVFWRYPSSLAELRTLTPRPKRTGGVLLDAIVARLN